MPPQEDPILRAWRAQQAAQAAREFASLPPEDRLGDQPLETDVHETMKELGRLIDAVLNGDAKGKDRTTGFVLLTFPFGDRSGRCNFLSNGADRRDMVALFKEMAARFEGQPEQSGRA